MVKTAIAKTRKNKKKNKTQIGGQINNMNTNQSINKQLNEQLNEQIDDKPNIKNNIKKFADIWIQAFNYMGLYALDKVENKIEETSKSFGINPNERLENQITKIGKNVERFNQVLDTPEGKRALSNLNALFDKITKRVIIPSSQKLADGLIENLQPIMIKGQNAVFALLSASPFGAIIDIPRFLSESLGVVEKSVSLADDVLDISQEAVDEIKKEKSNYDKIVSEFSSLLNKVNTGVSSGLNSVGNVIDNYGKKIVDNEKMQSSQIRPIQSGGELLNDDELLKKYQNQSKMIGGRIMQSQMEFFKPYTNSSQFLKQTGGRRSRTFKRKKR